MVGWIYKTKPVRKFFKKFFDIPTGCTVVSIGWNSIHFTEDFKTFRARCYQHNVLDVKPLKWLQIVAMFPVLYISKGLAIPLLTDTTATNNKDTAISQYTPTTNYGSSASVGYVASQTGGDDWRFLVHLTLPSGSGTISAVKLYLYKTTSAGSDTSQNIEVHELSRTDWTEAGATWNKYDGTNNWTTAGGDFSATIVSSVAHNTSTNVWRSWDIGPGATNPISGLTWGSNVHLILRFSTANSNPAQYENYNNKNDASNKPYIEITYTTSSVNSNFLAFM